MLQLYDMYNIVNVPTRITVSNATLLGLLITNCPEELTTFNGIISADISDHMPTFICVRSQFSTNKHSEVCYRTISVLRVGSYSELGLNGRYH